MKPTKRGRRGASEFNWAAAIGAAVAGAATLAVGYLIGREEQQQAERERQHQQRFVQYNTGSSSTSSSAVLSTQGNPAMEVDEPTDDENSACKICYNNVACAVTLPCRHQACCMSCVRQLTRCPICNCPTEKVIRVFKA